MFLTPFPMVYTFRNLFVSREYDQILMTSNNRILFLISKLLKQGYRYHKIRKAFSKFYHRHSELILIHNIGLKALLQQGISVPIFYGDLVYKFKIMSENLILMINQKDYQAL